ncbi:uncharacterized protein LOC144004035 [Festucalex cinctus]
MTLQIWRNSLLRRVGGSAVRGSVVRNVAWSVPGTPETIPAERGGGPAQATSMTSAIESRGLLFSASSPGPAARTTAFRLAATGGAQPASLPTIVLDNGVRLTTISSPRLLSGPAARTTAFQPAATSHARPACTPRFSFGRWRSAAAFSSPYVLSGPAVRTTAFRPATSGGALPASFTTIVSDNGVQPAAISSLRHYSPASAPVAHSQQTTVFRPAASGGA